VSLEKTMGAIKSKKITDSAKRGKEIVLLESRGKTQGEKKTMMKKIKECEKINKNLSFYAKNNEIKNVFYSNKSMIALLYKEAYFNTNKLDHCLPSVVVS